MVSDSAWTRLRAWHLHAPAERLPLPLILTAWPSAWVLHAVHVPGHVVTYAAVGRAVAAWLTWRRHRKNSPHPRLAATEAAMVTAAAGGWLAAAVTSGPLGWPAHLLTLDLPGRRRSAATGGCAGTRRSALPASAARTPAAWAARKAEWHRIAHLIGLGDFHLQAVTPDAPGRGAAAHQRPGQRAGHPRGGEQQAVRGEVRAPARACPTAGSTSAPPSTPASWSSRSGRRTRRSTARSPTRRSTRTRRSKTGSRSAAASATRSPSG